MRVADKIEILKGYHEGYRGVVVRMYRTGGAALGGPIPIRYWAEVRVGKEVVTIQQDHAKYIGKGKLSAKDKKYIKMHEEREREIKLQTEKFDRTMKFAGCVILGVIALASYVIYNL